MAIYSYKKGESNINEKKELLVVKKNNTEESKLWLWISSRYNKLTDNRPAGWISLIIPTILILIGITLLISEISPQILSFVEARLASNIQDPISVVSDDYYSSKSQFISSPESGYFSKLISQVKAQESDLVSPTFKEDFYLTIPKLDTKRARIKANIKSDVESIYRPVLENNLAHFAGTPIPGQNGNSFIYGHSMNEARYTPNPNNPVVEFTKLGKLNTGDKLSIEISGKTLNYTVSLIKIINPNETDILGNRGGKTITLMTCYPFGNNAKRLVVVARQIED